LQELKVCEKSTESVKWHGLKNDSLRLVNKPPHEGLIDIRKKRVSLQQSV